VTNVYILTGKPSKKDHFEDLGVDVSENRVLYSGLKANSSLKVFLNFVESFNLLMPSGNFTYDQV
jgi:hypothetical protein